MPQVGVTHHPEGSFADKYDDGTIADILRTAQATQVCTKCNTAKARDDFEQGEWARRGDERLCRTCNVRACRKCGASKARTDFEQEEWARQKEQRGRLRLRRPRSHEFVSFEHCLKVMWHEMAHIVHGNHSAAFYQEMDDIARHYELIKSKGQLVGLDGFPIGGGRNADPQRHNPSRAEGRAAGLKAAEARAKKQRVMGGGRLGGGAAHKKLSPREAAARAAERRAQDARNGLGEAELEVAAGRGEKRKSGPGLVWDGTFRAVCPVCGPVCTDKVEHAEVISDSDDDDLAGPVDYTLSLIHI